MRWLLTVSDTHPSLQASDARGVKDISDHAIRLDLVKPSTLSTSDDTGGILATDKSAQVLQSRLWYTHRCCNSESPSALRSQMRSTVLTRRPQLTSPHPRLTSASPVGREGGDQGYRTLIISTKLLTRAQSLTDRR